MDLHLSAEEGAFRKELVAWLAEVERPSGLRDYGHTPTAADVEPAQAWQKVLCAAGYAGLAWPVEHGGRGAGPLEQAIYAEELARAGLPRQVSTVSIDLAGPALMRFGTPEQKERFLGPTLRGELLWTQLFSEPDAGSDLVSLRTTAVADGDGWAVNGQKVWNSGAHFAHVGLLLARTERDAPPHRSLTFFLLPMDRAGIDVRPLRQMDGEVKFNEVALVDVALERGDVLGTVGQGWSVAIDMLGRERAGLGAHAVTLLEALDELRDEARRRGVAGDRVFRQRWTALWGRVTLLRLSWLRELATDPDAASPVRSVLKLESTVLQQQVGLLAQDVVGATTMAWEPGGREWGWNLLQARGATLAGGTSEIQRNIIAERALGLPR